MLRVMTIGALLREVPAGDRSGIVAELRAAPLATARLVRGSDEVVLCVPAFPTLTGRQAAGLIERYGAVA